MLTWLVAAIVALATLLTPTGAALASWRIPQATVVSTVGERIVELRDELRPGRNATASAARSLGRAQLSPQRLGVPSPAHVLSAAGASTALTGLGRAQRSEHGRRDLAASNGGATTR